MKRLQHAYIVDEDQAVKSRTAAADADLVRWVRENPNPPAGALGAEAWFVVQDEIRTMIDPQNRRPRTPPHA